MANAADTKAQITTHTAISKRLKTMIQNKKKHAKKNRVNGLILCFQNVVGTCR